LSENCRNKINFFAYDRNVDYLKSVGRLSSNLHFAKLLPIPGDLSEFVSKVPSALKFDFITLTNTIHEIEPPNFAKILVDCVCKLAPKGSLFIYDMERLPEAELGAIVWKTQEIKEIITLLAKQITKTDYVPSVGKWHHSSCDGWNVQISRQHISLTEPDLNKKKKVITKKLSNKILEILNRKYDTCIESLESLTEFGGESLDEFSDKVNLVFEYWALNRLKGKIL
jgi:hypothetical protein